MIRSTATIPVWLIALTLSPTASALQSSDTPAAAAGELVASWNEQVLEVAEAEDRFLTLKGLRTAAMMHLAMHDALNAIRPRYATWRDVPQAPGADPMAAAAQAAFIVASDQYPDQEPRFREELAVWLSRAPDGAAKTAGIDLGTATAAAILAARASDRWDGEGDYRWQEASPGVYAGFPEHSGTPPDFVFGAGWAAAEPFAVDDLSRFRVPPPPAIDSDAYARAFEEVRELGARDSDKRTADQRHLAMWWKEFVESSHNRLARRLVREEGLDLWKAARMFAQLQVSLYDGYVAVFHNKFRYNHWRPYTAIRRADDDGNPHTEGDPDWDNLHRHTYAFPSYPSAHGTACAAAMTVLAHTFGSERPVTMTIDRVDRGGPLSEKIPMDPASRSFESFAAAAEECSLSRVYLGIHFRYDSVAGTGLGRSIGSWVVDRFLAAAGDGVD